MMLVLKQIEDHIKDELKSRPEKKRGWRTYGCGEDKGSYKVARPFDILSCVGNTL